jgi:hypothetical protein
LQSNRQRAGKHLTEENHILTDMPVETQKMLRSELNFDEKLIWSGQPLANRVGSGSLVLVLVGIPLTVLSVVWVVVVFWVMVSWKMNSSASSSPSSGPPLFAFVFPLFGVPFVLAGLWMLSAPGTGCGARHKRPCTP